MCIRTKRFLFSLSGPYGVGKDTLLDAIHKRYPERLHRIRALTTRSVDERVDRWYESVSLEELQHRTSKGRWIVNGQLGGSVTYATSIDEINSAHDSGLVCIQSIFPGPDGAGKLRELFGCSLLSIGIAAARESIDVQLAVLRERLTRRGRDTAELINIRLRHQHEPILYIEQNPLIESPDGPMRGFDESIVNDNLQVANENVANLVEQFMRHN